MNRIQYFLLLFFAFMMMFSCINQNKKETILSKMPVVHHDVSYIPFDINQDDKRFVVCDSTNILSGRNRLQYAGGRDKLNTDIRRGFEFDKRYESFSGFIVIRFLINCNGESGRYRAAALNLDFSYATVPQDLVDQARELIIELDDWKKSSSYDINNEYSKFINLKISNGKIQHVLL